MNRDEELETFRDMVYAGLAREQLPTGEEIRGLIEKTRRIFSSVTVEQAEDFARELEEVHGVTMEIGSKLEGRRGFEKWLEDAKSEINPYYWNRYKKLLAGREKMLSGQVLAMMDQVTDRILGLLGNPQKQGPWDRRGMVVGHVQSGKTANYIGLMNKASDAGYKIIVVIAGIQNKLRNQTQSRVDEGFIGFDSSSLLKNKSAAGSFIGVGRYDKTHRPSPFTNTLKDFNKDIATGVGIPLVNLKTPAVFVIKKNYNSLGNLIEWLKEHNAQHSSTPLITEPMLLIDDEADHASINTKKGRDKTGQDKVSRINGQIRDLLKIFHRSSYVGYTATPFANIFINPDTDHEMFSEDLFPRDFIVGLDPPDNYFGATRVFLPNTGEDEEEGSPIVRHIEDNEDILPMKHGKEHKIVALPCSLEDAVRMFIVARAVRLSRGQQHTHNSMLVNVSYFTAVQNQIKNEIHNLVKRIENNIVVNASSPVEEAVLDPEIATLKNLFDREYSNVDISWKNVQGKLRDSVASVKVIAINRDSPDALDYSEYPNGLNVITVGGHSLSRGLTLEGLVISYFLRSSMMYDTLMQMGRWFGYRQGYEDLCRVWMPEEAEGWYAHIAESIEELRDELRRMEAVGATPEEFGLKVRSHPDTLIVTARNKMGSGQKLILSIGLANQFVETTALHKDGKAKAHNHRAAIKLAKSLQDAGLELDVTKFGKIFRQVPVNSVLDFLRAFKNHQGSRLTETRAVCRYVMDREGTELSEWDILFAGLKKDNGKTPIDASLGFEIICQRRKEGKRSKDKKDYLLIGDKQHVASRGIEAIDLSEEEKNEAKKEYRERRSRAGKDNKSINYPDFIYREKRKRPLLIIHLLVIGEENEDLKDAEPVVAYGISFPRTKYEEKKVEYIVNPTWMREHYGDLEDEDDIEEEDDED